MSVHFGRSGADEFFPQVQVQIFFLDVNKKNKKQKTNKKQNKTKQKQKKIPAEITVK